MICRVGRQAKRLMYLSAHAQDDITLTLNYWLTGVLVEGGTLSVRRCHGNVGGGGILVEVHGLHRLHLLLL